jgi:DNA-binding NtrC family response regulator
LPAQQRSLVLVVDPDVDVAAAFGAAVETIGHHRVVHTDFQAARREIRERRIDALVSNVRLASFNGIHLAYSAGHAPRALRVMLYASHHDPLLARETQLAGAFYERQRVVPFVLERFLAASLPSGDRRDVSTFDRRTAFRGGRRSRDMVELQQAPTFLST